MAAGSPTNDTLSDLGWPHLIECLVARAATELGEEELRQLALFARPEDAQERMEEIGEARRLAVSAAPMPFAGIGNVAAAVARAEKGGVLEPADLIAVAKTARGLAALGKHLATWAAEAPRLAARAGAISDLGHVFHPILESFDDAGRLADHASDELGKRRARVTQLHGELERRGRALVEEMAQHLQDRYFTQRDERYVLPIKVESRGFVKGIVHGTSQSGHTVFVEPDELVDRNNQLRLAECAVADEEQRILVQLSGYVAEEVGALRAGLEAAASLDLVSACARLADDMGATAAEIDRGGALSLGAARHPLMVLAGRRCVANDIALAPSTILVISGPNAGGKSVTLKTVGLILVMVRAGLLVPAAEGSRVPWFSAMHTEMGDAQSIENDLSTFSAHLLKIRQFLADADDSTWLLVDEIAAGTDPEQGAALAIAALEHLAKRGVAAIVTTHFEKLKAFAAGHDRFANASVGFDLERMEPTFRLHLGIPGSSGALALARRLELPQDVVARAEELLGDKRTEVDRLLGALAAEQRDVAASKAAAAEEWAAAKEARRGAELAREAARAKQQSLRREAHSEAIRALRGAREELDRVRARVRRHIRGDEVVQARRSVDALSRRIAEHEPERPDPGGTIPRREELVPGTPVLVAPLHGRGHVLAVSPAGKVTVQLGSIRTAVEIADLRLEGGGAPELARESRTPRPGRIARLRRENDEVPRGEAAVVLPGDATLDLRGERVEEALGRLDAFIDRSLLSDRDVILVIHGHGSGALRRAVRDHLGDHAAVARWRPGEPAEGGDGVTVVTLGAG